MTAVQFVVRLVLAQLLGAAVGVERQWRQRMAGLRTNALVATGAALFVMLGSMMREQVISRLSLEPGVSAVSWKVIENSSA